MSKKEKPILFSTPMVQALLNTKPGVWPAEPVDPDKPFKWQTRREVKQKVDEFENGLYVDRLGAVLDKSNVRIAPYEVDDILWVRETWSKDVAGIIYKAGEGITIDINNEQSLYFASKAKWKPSIHMPRAAARIFLEVKSVRIAQLWEITEKDAKAEGVLPMSPFDLKQIPLSITEPGGKYGKGQILNSSYKASYYKLWESLNEKRGFPWDGNPWVFAYEFMRGDAESAREVQEA